MGSRTIASCQCGYSKDLKIGGTRATFAFCSYFPAVCLDCEEIFDLNYKLGEYKIDLKETAKTGKVTRTEIPIGERNYTCEKCNGENVIVYNDNRLIGTSGEHEILRSFDYFLTNGTYYCPKCKQMDLQFWGSISFFD